MDAGQNTVSEQTRERAVNSTATRKRRKASKPSTLSQFTIHNPSWAYIHLTLVTSSNLPGANTSMQAPSAHLDGITAHLHLQAALQQFLGLHGTAIPIDVMRLDKQDVWIRVPRDDGSAVVAAVGGWIGKGGEGWRIKDWGYWGPKMEASGMDLFEG